VGTSSGMASVVLSVSGANTGLERTPVRFANMKRENIAKGANLPERKRVELGDNLIQLSPCER